MDEEQLRTRLEALQARLKGLDKNFWEGDLSEAEYLRKAYMTIGALRSIFTILGEMGVRDVGIEGAAEYSPLVWKWTKDGLPQEEIERRKKILIDEPLYMHRFSKNEAGEWELEIEKEQPPEDTDLGDEGTFDPFAKDESDYYDDEMKTALGRLNL